MNLFDLFISIPLNKLAQNGLPCHDTVRAIYIAIMTIGFFVVADQ